LLRSSFSFISGAIAWQSARSAAVDACGFADSVDAIPAAAGSQTAWPMAVPVPAGLQNSHQNGGRLFLIFVADP